MVRSAHDDTSTRRGWQRRFGLVALVVALALTAEGLPVDEGTSVDAAAAERSEVETFDPAVQAALAELDAEVDSGSTSVEEEGPEAGPPELPEPVPGQVPMTDAAPVELPEPEDEPMEIIEVPPPAPEEEQELAPDGAVISTETVGDRPEPDGEEVVDRRQETAKVYDNGDGTFTAELYDEPVHWKDGKGRWQDIDTSLRQQPSGAFRNTSAAVGVHVANDAGASVLGRLDVGGGREVAWTLDGAHRKVGVVEDSVVTYEDALPDVDVRLTSEATALKEELVLKERGAPNEYVFPLTVKGLEPRLEGGQVLFRDAEGVDRVAIPHAWMEDSRVDPQTGDGAISHAATYELVPWEGGTALRLTLDQAWLDDPARVYPIVVDPTTSDIGPEFDDTFVMAGRTANNANDPELKVGNFDGQSLSAAYLKFDAVGWLTGMNIRAATLYLNNHHSWSCSPRGVGVYRVTQAWGGTTMTGYPGATYGERVAWSSFAKGRPECPGGYARWDLKNLVTSWTDGSLPNFGVTLRVDPGSESDEAAWKKFSSSQAVNPPILRVTYSEYGATYKTLGAFTQNVTNTQDGALPVRVTNTGKHTWPANGMYRLSYHAFNAATGQRVSVEPVRTFLPVSVAKGQSVDLSARIGKLPPGEYRIALDMVLENTTWFSDDGSPSLAFTIHVKNQRPRITAASPANGFISGDRSPELSVTADDPDLWPNYGLQYLFRICERGTTTCWESGWRTQSTWAPPNGTLYFRKSYEWSVEVSDHVASTKLESVALTTEVIQPKVERHLGSDPTSANLDGVNPAIGNVLFGVTDVHVGGAGPSLELSRNYNSLDPGVGMFGLGWMTPFDMRAVIEHATGTVLITHGDGRRERFGMNADGSYSGSTGFFSTLRRDNLEFVLTDKEGTTYRFNARGLLSRVTDLENRFLELTWQNDGSLSTIRSATSGRALHLTWADGHVVEVRTDPVGGTVPTWTYRYEGERLVEACAPAAGARCTSYAYTPASHPSPDRMQRATLPRGNVYFTADYAADGKVKWRQNGAGGRWSFTRRNLWTGSRVDVTDPRGNATVWQFDTRNRLTSRTDEIGKRRTFRYNDMGYLGTVTDENGNSITLGTNDRGEILNRTVVRDGMVLQSHRKYFEGAPGDLRNGKLIASSDARSSSSTDNTFASRWSYDEKGRLIHEGTPGTPDHPWGRYTLLSYTDGSEGTVGGGVTPSGLLKTSTDPAGRVTSYRYDAKGDLREVTAPTGLRTEFVYDALGRERRVTELSDAFPAGVATTTAYDAAGRVTRMTGPEVRNAVTGAAQRLELTYRYDANGNLLSTVEADVGAPAAARTTSFTYDAQDREATRTDPEGGVHRSRHDVFGNLDQTVDPLGTVTELTYTARNEPWKTIVKGFVDDPVNPGTPRDVVLESRAYDPAGRLATVTDAADRTTRFEYHTDDLLVREILTGFGGAGELVLNHFGYDKAGNRTVEVQGGGRRIILSAFDAAGRLTDTSLDPFGVGRHTTFGYDAVGNVTSESLLGKDGTAFRQTWSYDAGNRPLVSAVDNGDGTSLRTVRTFDQRGVVKSVTDPRGTTGAAPDPAFTTTFVSDAIGRITEAKGPGVVVDELDKPAVFGVTPTVKTGYDAVGNPTQSVDARGALTTTTFDRLGRPTRVALPSYTPPGSTTALRPVIAVGYDRLGRATSVTDQRGGVTATVYDRLGRAVSVTEPTVAGLGAATTRQRYDDVGNVVETTDATGARTQFAYDQLDRVVTVSQVERYRTAMVLRSTFTYDDVGNPLSSTTPKGLVTKMAYNGAGDLVITHDPGGKRTQYAYDGIGRLTRTTDPLGRATGSSYDGAGRPTSTTRYGADGAALEEHRFGYDRAGNLTTVRRPSGATSTFFYDASNSLVAQLEPAQAGKSLLMSFGYDANRNRTRQTDGRANTTWTTHNPWNLVEKVVEPSTAAHPGVADRTWQTTYDVGGLPVQERAPGGVTRTRTYDALGRLTAETGSGAEAATAARSLGYDLVGRLTRAGHPGGTSTYRYNDRGLLLAANGPAGSATFGYDGDGRTTTRTDAAGTTTFAYDARGLLASATEPLAGTTQRYGYDDAGQLQQVDYGTGKGLRALTHDGLGRIDTDVLHQSTGVARSVDFDYDVNSNVVAKTTSPAVVAGAGRDSYTYDAADRLTGWTAPNGTVTPYAWDDAANRIQAGPAQFEYDERNRLVKETTGGTAKSYAYTARGTLRTAGNVTTGFDAFDRLVSSGGVSYTYDALDRIAARNGTAFSYAGLAPDPVSDGAQRYARGLGDAALSVADGSQAAGVIADGRGDVVATLSAAGVLTSSRAYDPWGTPTATKGTFQPSVGYQGDWTDSATKAVHMHARWYQPGTGAFTSRDSFTVPALSGSYINRTAYANANPLRYNDPTGHFIIALPFIPPAIACAAKCSAAIAAGIALGTAYLAGQELKKHTQSNSGSSGSSRVSDGLRTESRTDPWAGWNAIDWNALENAYQDSTGGGGGGRDRGGRRPKERYDRGGGDGASSPAYTPPPPPPPPKWTIPVAQPVGHLVPEVLIPAALQPSIGEVVNDPADGIAPEFVIDDFVIPEDLNKQGAPIDPNCGPAGGTLNICVPLLPDVEVECGSLALSMWQTMRRAAGLRTDHTCTGASPHGAPGRGATGGEGASGGGAPGGGDEDPDRAGAGLPDDALPAALRGGSADVHVYMGVRNGKPVYTGITNNLGRRQDQHGDRFVLQQVTPDPLTRGQARAVEQALIARNPGFENAINSISPRHSYYQQAVDWGEAWLRANGYG